ncbi:hypothetical protein T10_6842 [Trichinella papuae]|uniref:Uncharacterized protein n=1 Tax=Trichinella papuae TaxID=268474 RepID=A0A0V1LZE5_9BILA|nr:hypothetical protein T10_6842 [Trichinella papuae]
MLTKTFFIEINYMKKAKRECWDTICIDFDVDNVLRSAHHA